MLFKSKRTDQDDTLNDYEESQEDAKELQKDKQQQQQKRQNHPKVSVFLLCKRGSAHCLITRPCSLGIKIVDNHFSFDRPINYLADLVSIVATNFSFSSSKVSNF